MLQIGGSDDYSGQYKFVPDFTSILIFVQS